MYLKNASARLRILLKRHTRKWVTRGPSQPFQGFHSSTANLCLCDILVRFEIPRNHSVEEAVISQPETNVPPIAVLRGESVKLPEDLYIPPDALRIFLEAFEGPLDLLLYLIKRQNIDILDIPIT